MSIIEIHLILNHIPIIGVAFVSVELLIGLLCKNTFLQKISLYFLISFALIAIAVYFSGLGSEDLVKSLPGVSNTYLQLHEKVARIASVSIWFIGGLTFLGLVSLRGRDGLFKYFVRGIFAMTLLSTGLFVLTGYLGGQIANAEIRSTFAEGLSTRALSIGVVGAMVAIIIAMLVPLFVNRDKIFKKARVDALGGTGDWQSQEPRSKQEALAQQDAVISTNGSWAQPVPYIATNSLSSRSVDLALPTQAFHQWQNAESAPRLNDTAVQRTLSSLAMGYPSGSVPYGTDGTLPNDLSSQPTLSDPRIRLNLPSRPQQGSLSSASGLLRGQEPRSLTEEETKPLPALPKPPQRRGKGKRRLYIVLGVLCIAVIVAGGVGYYVIHKLTKYAPLQLQVITTVPVSNQAGRFDYESLDPRTGLLFISYPGNNSALIFDTKSNKLVAEVPGIKDGHGVVTIPELGRAYVSAGGTNEVVAIDELTHRILARIPTGAGPDGIAYDPVDHKLFVSDEDGHSDTVIDVLTEKQLAIIPLGGEAGNTQYDPVSNRIYINVQTLTQLVAVDPKSYSIVGRYPLTNCNHNHGLNIDSAQNVAFIACDVSNTLLMVDMHSMKILDTASSGVEPDVLALDSGRHLLYVATESGNVSIFEILTNTVHRLSVGFVSIHAHTIAVNQQTHDIYLPLQNVNGRTIIEVAFFQP